MARHKILRSPRSARKEHRRKSRKILFFSVLFLLATGGIIYTFSRPEFRITSIEVIGSGRVSAERIQKSVREGMSGTIFGFIPKSHTFFFPKDSLSKSLKKEFPIFSSVSLSLQNLAALRVIVHEREPKALWCVSTKECFFVDKTGFVFAPAEGGTEQMYYRFEKEAASSPIGTKVVDPTKFSQMFRFLKDLEQKGLNPERMLLNEHDEVEVTLRGGTRLLLKDGEYDLALSNLETLLGQDGLLSKKGGELSVDYVDLRYGNKIYYKPR